MKNKDEISKRLDNENMDFIWFYPKDNKDIKHSGDPYMLYMRRTIYQDEFRDLLFILNKVENMIISFGNKYVENELALEILEVNDIKSLCIRYKNKQELRDDKINEFLNESEMDITDSF